MLTLEDRILGAILPEVAGRHVVDIGCGTGRWLARFAAGAPASLTGVDASHEMLLRATAKLGRSAVLVESDCASTLLRARSKDLILCSFLVSYVPDLDRLARELARIARPGADIFITDVHPVTQSLLRWKRGFQVGDARFEVANRNPSLADLVAFFDRVRLETFALIEPRFGEPEAEMLRLSGKQDLLQAGPAIYVLHLKTPKDSRQPAYEKSRSVYLRQVCGARLTLGAKSTMPADALRPQRAAPVAGSVRSRTSRSWRSRSRLDLRGFLIFPGLVNAHDHLEFALFPRLGSGNYRNYIEWAQDIYHPGDSPVREHLAVPKAVRLFWGGIRNLLCGATTVCHHNPYAREVFGHDFPVRVVRNFRWAHSLSLGKHVANQHKRTPKGSPFIIHLCEGVDERSAKEIFELARTRGLDSRTVLVHGLGLDERGRQLARASGAALIWCPTSNVFLFGRTHSRESLRVFAQIALGNDSPLTAQGDLLDEVHFAHAGIGIAADELYDQVTWRSAQVLRLAGGEGSLRVGALNDFVAVRDRGLTPAETLVTITWRDVELVVIDGRVQLASQGLYEQLASRMKSGLQFLAIEDEIRWVRAPISRLLRETWKALGPEIRLGGRRVSNERAS